MNPAYANRDCTTINGAQQCYNGLPTIRRKTQWAMANAGGMMNWELSQDTNGANSLVSAIYDDRDRRRRPRTRRPAAPGRSPASAGKCVDVAAASTANGTAVQLYTCNGTNAQTWTVATRQHAARAGQVHGRRQRLGTANGTNVQLWDCNGTGAQVWQAQSNSTLRNPQSEQVPRRDAATARADGTRLQIWDCFAGANQRWTLPA